MPGWLARLLDLLAPEVCRLCTQNAAGAAPWVCEGCIQASPPPPVPTCVRCTRMHTGAGHGCGPIVRAATPYDAAARVPAAVALRMLKFDGRCALARPLAALLRARIPMPRRGLLVPVPLHAARLRGRGYNQAALVARHLANLTGLPVCPDLLTRTRDRPPQATLGRGERLHNVDGTIAVRRAPPSWRRVILVDDVCTTGATLRVCADALHGAGVRRVEAVVVARRTLLSEPARTR